MSRNPRIALFVLLVLVAVPTLRALAGPGEGSLASNINSARSSSGLAPLESHSTLISYSRQHSEEMLASNSIYHSSNSQLTSLVSGWSRIGENVGRGPDASSIFNAFMGSSGHRANILGDFTHMGVGTAEDPDGVLYVTIVFMKLATSTTTTTAPSPTTTTAPSPTTTTAPPPTTTAAPPPTTKPPSSTTSVVTSSSTSTIPELSTEEAVACAVAALGSGSADEMGTTDLAVTTCEEAVAAAASWPEGTEVGAVAGDPGVVILTFTAPTPTTVTTTTTTSTTTSTTAPTTVAPTTTTTTTPHLDLSTPASPGAADLVRLVAGTILGFTVLFGLVVMFRRRR